MVLANGTEALQDGCETGHPIGYTQYLAHLIYMSTIVSIRPRLRGFTPFALAVISLFALILYLYAGPGSPAPVQAQGSSCPAQSICNVTVEPSSRTPTGRSEYEVTFVTPSPLAALTDSIVMVLHEDIVVPQAISPSLVRVQFGSGSANRGTASDVSLQEADDPRHPTTITISPGFTGSGSGERRPLNIPAGEMVTITFDRNVRISNPTQGGSFSWTVHTSKNSTPVLAKHPEDDALDRDLVRAFRASSPDGSATGLLVDREIELSIEEAARGESITVIARGYRNGHTLTVWRDANLDGRRGTEERELCSTIVGSDDIAYCDFTVTVPPFAPEVGKCYPASNDSSDVGLNCNFINAVDGISGSSIILGKGTARIEEADQLLELVPRINVGSVQGPGGDIQLELIDFPQGVIASINIAGVPVEVDPLSIGPTGNLHFSITVPNEVRLGSQTLRILVSLAGGGVFSDSVIVDIIQTNTEVRVFPETVLPNQRVSLSGLGFTDIANTTIDEVRVETQVLESNRINGGEGSIEVDDGGRWSGSVELPVNEATTTPGTKTLTVKDSYGRAGSTEIIIPSSKVTVSPPWGHPGSVVEVTGTGFPARNYNGSNVNLRIYYESAIGYVVTYVETDVNGNFSGEVRIPPHTTAPSSNFIRVEFDDDDGRTISTSVRHEIPSASLVFSPASGPPGTRVTISGKGFRGYTPVQSAVIGTIDITPSSTVTTNAQGELAMSFLVPGIGTGLQTVRVSVAGRTGSGTFKISLSGVQPGDPTPVAQAMKNLGDRFVRSFHFDNDSKLWSFYDPTAIERSDLLFMVSGEIYLVQVSETVDVILNGKSRRLYCYQGNCWNQIVW